MHPRSGNKAALDFSSENFMYWILIAALVLIIWAIVSELIRKIVSV